MEHATSIRSAVALARGSHQLLGTQDLREHMLTALPQAIGALIALRKLDLRCNRLAAVPGATLVKRTSRLCWMLCWAAATSLTMVMWMQLWWIPLCMPPLPLISCTVKMPHV